MVAIAGGVQGSVPPAPAGQPQGLAKGDAAAFPAPAPSQPTASTAGSPSLPGPASPGAAPGATPARFGAAGKPAQAAEDDAPPGEQEASEVDGAASAGPALSPEPTSLIGVNWSGQAAPVPGAAQSGAAAPCGKGVGGPPLDAAPTQAALPAAAGSAAPGIAAPRGQPGLSFAGAVPGPVPAHAGPAAVDAPAAGCGLQRPGARPLPGASPEAASAGAGSQDAARQVKGAQVVTRPGTGTPGAAHPVTPGAAGSLAPEGVEARQDDGGQLADSPRLATASLKLFLQPGNAQTEPSGAAARDAMPGAAGGTASQPAGNLAGQASGPALTPVLAMSGPAPAQPTATPAPAAAPSHAALVSPAPDQLRTAFTAAASLTGPSRVVVRLDPAELGRVQIGIVRQPDGPSRIELLAERPETLQLLMRDQPALHRALDLAGVPVEGRTLHFQVGSPDPAASPAPTLQPGAGGSMGSPGGGSQLGSGRNQPPGWSGSAARDPHPGPVPHSAFRPAHGLRAGVDITA